ncbi:MAG: allantoate amidohydrolase [Ponticaulis sp.]|nr:allantoate amidohydrolase [Ponticaulis sp.]
MVAASGHRAVARCDALGATPYSTSPDFLYRGYLSSAHAEAVNQTARWMQDAGMSVRMDAAANLIGRYEAVEDGLKTLLIGSHIDSVRNGGRYDGPLGVMLGIECVAHLNNTGKRLPFAIEVIAFGDEEGSRFPVAMMCSKAVIGELVMGASDMQDRDGVSLAEALDQFEHQIDLTIPEGSFGAARRNPGDILAFVEAHIEQGPALESEQLSVGAVSGIAAQLRYEFRIKGEAGHAGTNQMHLRRDPLAGAAEIMVEIERLANAGEPDEVATVGRIEALPGAANVVPGEVAFFLDVRAGEQVRRDALADKILARAAEVCDARKLIFSSEKLQDLAASPSDPKLLTTMEDALEETGHKRRTLVSGAGHDAMILAEICPTVMLFIRCDGGISHNPLERVEPQDADDALKVMLKFLELMEARANDQLIQAD